MPETRKSRREQIRGFADKSFADHQLTKVSDGTIPQMFRCGKPGTGMYSFTVTFIPGNVIVTGDLSGLILCCYDKDSLSWLMKAHNDLDYMLGKAENKEREFVEYEAEQCVQEWIKEGYLTEEKAAEIRDYKHQDDALDPGVNWLRACCDADIDDPPHCDDWSSQMLWQAYALQKFVELYDAMQVVVPENAA